MTLIKIFKSRNDPLARLSDNFPQDMVIGGDTYRSVTNYIYSNMLRTPILKSMLIKSRPQTKCDGKGNCSQHNRSMKDCKKAGCSFSVLSVLDQYFEHSKKENNELIKNAIDTALEAKLSESESVSELLLSTENRPIIYVSNNEFLGIGRNNNGQNEYGKALQAMRVRFTGVRSQQVRADNIIKMNRKKYNTYVAYMNLTSLLMSGNDLSEYVGMTSSEVLSKMKVEGFNIRMSPDQGMVVSEINRDKRSSNGKTWINENVIIAISKPKTIAALVRGESLQKLVSQHSRKERKTVLGMYMDYMLRKNYPDVKEDQYKKARNQQLTTIGAKELIDLETRVFRMYKEGMLSASLSDLIDAVKISAPTQEDMDNAEAMADAIKKSFNNISEINTPIMNTSISGEPVFVYASLSENQDNYDILAPLDTTNPIYVEGRDYPSISYYIFTMILASLHDMDINKAYKFIKNKDGFKILQELERDVERAKSESHHAELIKYATIALRSKFQNRESQNTLLGTGDSTLLWDDRKDPILGSGLPERENFIGKTLEKIRDEIRVNRGSENLDKLSTDDISKVFQNKFITSWFRMRVRDMCNAIITMKDYMYVKYKIVQRLDVKFITTVLDDVYQPCSHIFAAIDQIKVDPPDKFVSMVRRYHGCRDLSNDSVSEIWKRLAVVIYYFINHLNNSSSVNIAIVLGRIEGLTSQQKVCEPIIPDPEENCILGAILNILKGIIRLDNKYGNGNGLEPVDFDAAITILLNINSLTEQRAERLRKNGVKKVKRELGSEDVKEVETTLKQEGYSDEIIQAVIEEIKNYGEVPKNVSQIAFSIKFNKKNSDDDKSSQNVNNVEDVLGVKSYAEDGPVEDDRSNEIISWAIRTNRDPTGPSGMREEDEIWLDDHPEVMDYIETEYKKQKEQKEMTHTWNSEKGAWILRIVVQSDDDDLGVFGEDFADDEEEEEEIDTGPVPNSDIVEKIKLALEDNGVNRVDLIGKSIAFTVDESIRFVKNYSMTSKIKTNRINFFASSA